MRSINICTDLEDVFDAVCSSLDAHASKQLGILVFAFTFSPEISCNCGPLLRPRSSHSAGGSPLQFYKLWAVWMLKMQMKNVNTEKFSNENLVRECTLWLRSKQILMQFYMNSTCAWTKKSKVQPFSLRLPKTLVIAEELY